MFQQIQSARHASRILDLADVSQHDWHPGQILIRTEPSTQIDHAVLIDFASTSQTVASDDRILLQNYVGMFSVLRGRAGPVSLDEQLVWKYFGEQDNWDGMITFLSPDSPDKPSILEAKSLFPFIEVRYEHEERKETAATGAQSPEDIEIRLGPHYHA